jgi:hypothetical protein
MKSVWAWGTGFTDKHELVSAYKLFPRDRLYMAGRNKYIYAFLEWFTGDPLLVVKMSFRISYVL